MKHLESSHKEVRVRNYSTWETSISLLFGKTPKVTMICGECDYQFSRRFEPIDFRGGKFPRVMCQRCQTINVVSIGVH
jgi:hypothetical protein